MSGLPEVSSELLMLECNRNSGGYETDMLSLFCDAMESTVLSAMTIMSWGFSGAVMLG
jgi:hypothetical protein